MSDVNGLRLTKCETCIFFQTDPIQLLESQDIDVDFFHSPRMNEIYPAPAPNPNPNQGGKKKPLQRMETSAQFYETFASWFCHSAPSYTLLKCSNRDKSIKSLKEKARETHIMQHPSSK